MSSISEQKAAGKKSYRDELMEAGAMPTSEDRSFAQHKPGGSDTLPGWNKAKGAFNNVMGLE
ncbi:uncharacterized protein BJX67DRAFT_364308 [Aspergillus lucknowensis]|uniref:Uncharacterized protein n=1 Tax=Aspergillus lucknowensis TaxID=176173 RepID=A0ABR4LFF4_9EURO